MKKLFILMMAFVVWQLPTNAQIGETAGDFSGTDTHGNPINLYEILDGGQHVVLDFFFTTCGPCIFYAPQVNLAYKNYGCNTGDVFFLSIDHNDTDAEVLAYEATHGIEFPAISGLDGGGNAIVSQYGIQGFPRFYVISPSREIVGLIDPPTLEVFNFYFPQYGIQESSCNSGVDVTEVTDEFSLYPVPAVQDFMTIDFQQGFFGAATYEIIDQSGRVAQTSTIDVFGGAISVPMTGLAAGQYMIKIKPADSRMSYVKTFVR